MLKKISSMLCWNKLYRSNSASYNLLLVNYTTLATLATIPTRSKFKHFFSLKRCCIIRQHLSKENKVLIGLPCFAECACSIWRKKKQLSLVWVTIRRFHTRRPAMALTFYKSMTSWLLLYHSCNQVHQLWYLIN